MTTLPDSRLHLRVVAHSEVGLVRKNNQDSGYASPRLLVVADGMGGAAAGDLASAVAIDVIKGLDTPDLLAGSAAHDQGDTESSEKESDDTQSGDAADDGTEPTIVVPRPGDEPRQQGAAGRNALLGRFAAAIAEANSRIADLVAADYSLEGMGTTVTGALFDGHRLALAHIGDSRAYLLRDGRLERLTHDHSWVQSLVDDGKITAGEAAYHPHRSLLLKVLNGQPANDPDLTTVTLQPGDRLLFCSDGLCGMVDDDVIARLTRAPDLVDAAADLVDAALTAGGIDNITVILAEVQQGPDAAPAAASTHPDEDDTAVRQAVGTVLGAAVDREIPVVPRRSATVVPGSSNHDADADLDDDTELDEEAPPATAVASSPATPPARPDDESRYAPRPPAKRRIVRTLLIGLAVLLITAAGLGAGYAWTRTQYFVGASDGQVAIYQGLPDGIPGMPLSQVYEVQQLPVASLPPYYQAQVTAGIEVASLDAAHATVEQLKEAARRCTEPSPSPSPPPRRTPPPSPTATPTGKATPKETSATPPKATTSTSTGSSATTSVTAKPAPTPIPTPLPRESC